MYMYLSDRKRRMYLSLGLPQNLSSQNLSRKDRRFLQKTIKTNSCLSIPLIKQQILLYEKHIYSAHKYFLKALFPISSFSSICNTDIYFQVWQHSQNYKTIVGHIPYLFSKKGNTALSQEPISKPRYQPRNNISPVNSYVPYKYGFVYPSTSGDKPLVEFQGVGGAAKAPAVPMPVPELLGVRPSVYTQKPHPYLYPSVYKSLCIFIQTIKTKKLLHQGVYNVSAASLSNGYLYNNKNFDVTQHPLANPPLFVNGKNKYLFCRFLYNREHIKLCIKPQILPFSGPVQPVKSKILHEKKKVHLFYGCYAKKDFQRLSNSAKSLPGGFEDNMYTLLESRVDVLVHRAGFTKTIAMARQLIRQGALYVNGKKVCSCKLRACPGDIFTLQPQKERAHLRSCYIHTTKALYTRFLYKIKGETQIYRNLKLWKILQCEVSYRENLIRAGYLSPSLFLYKNLCKSCSHKTSNPSSLPSTQERAWACFLRYFIFLHKNTGHKGSYMQHFLNIYIAGILKRSVSTRKFFGNIKKKEMLFEHFMKNIQNANCASIWGQKPLHLEISQKTCAFIYLYRPQKIISPVCIDFYALKM